MVTPSLNCDMFGLQNLRVHTSANKQTRFSTSAHHVQFVCHFNQLRLQTVNHSRNTLGYRGGRGGMYVRTDELHTHTCTPTHARTHTHTHRHIHTQHTQAHPPTCRYITPTRAHTQTQHTRVHQHMPAHPHTHPHTHTHTHTHTRTHTHTHAHTHARTHT